ncbi:ABC transporter permease [Pseudoalteromonas luteoviolacea]|uniref:ABC transporter permease n=1 Tax=Pseudoalteromonas luteoviolacea TaxID=43657 RepID=UPI001B37893B|nr:ABC transporter permease [Pseudoalteromonas luteoviolacea]MBQ4839026.1 ABC transporter permease [Pseudoalteromonas luteoviolacea]
MFSSYITTAVRAFAKHKQHFALNVLGLSLGLAAAIMVTLFAVYEFSFDRTQPNAERVYRVHTDYRSWGLQFVGTAGTDAPFLMKQQTQVEDVLLLADADSLEFYNAPLALTVKVADRQVQLPDFYSVSNNLLDFVTLNVLAGSVQDAISLPDQLALSQSSAISLFGRTDIVGEQLNHGSGSYTVAAVFEDLPDNTHFYFHTLTALPKHADPDVHGYVYMRLAPNADATAIETELNRTFTERQQGRRKTLSLHMIPLLDVHFNSRGPFEMKQGGSKQVMWVSVALAVVLLLVASTNFINLNIAAAAKRAKEVGVRKALGASRLQLVQQFLTEAILVASVAGLIAFALVEIALPSVNQLLNRQLSLDFSMWFLSGVIVVILLVGVLSGLYPALFISSYSAKRVLSGDLQRGKTAIWVRKLTLYLQSVLSIALIIAAVTIYKQMALVNDLEVGYGKTERLLVKDLPAELVFKTDNNRLFDTIRSIPGVSQATASNTNLTVDMNGELHLTWPNGEQVEGTQPTVSTGFYAAETLGLTVLAGRDFSPQYGTDWAHTDEQGITRYAILISESMMRLAGYTDPQEVIGKQATARRGRTQVNIVGVVADVKLGSAKQTQLPISFRAGVISHSSANIVVKLDGSVAASDVAQQLRAVVTEQLKLHEVSVTRIEDEYQQAHISEHRVQQLVLFFSSLAVFLTCLGVLGLASFSALRRQKEVAVRKVLGASRISIVNLLAKEYLVLIMAAMVLSFPLSYWFLDGWLNHFNERISQAIWIYLFSASFVAVSTWLTVATLAFRAASIRPSLILRYE